MGGLSLVLLAAGESRRLGVPKALAKLREEEPSQSLSILLTHGRAHFEEPPLVIAGAHYKEISDALGSWRQEAKLHLNPNWKAGRSGGIQLAHTLRPHDDLCLAPLDVPAIESEVFAMLVRAWHQNAAPPMGWLAPFFRDDSNRKHFGHPLICGRELLERLATLPPETPLRRLRDAARPLLACPVPFVSILDDLDTPQDLERIRARLCS